MLTLDYVKALLSRITYPGLTFDVLERTGEFYLRVQCLDGTCNVTGDPCSWNGRKWLLEKSMTDGEVVQTAFKAVITALEHEAREQFKFLGESIFDGHYDIYKLTAFRASEGVIKERDPR